MSKVLIEINGTMQQDEVLRLFKKAIGDTNPADLVYYHGHVIIETVEEIK